MDRARVISKIEKCLSLSKDKTNLYEADSAKQMAEQLMRKYHIGLEELRLEKKVDYVEQIIQNNPSYWEQLLIYALSPHFGCYAVNSEVTRKNKKVKVIAVCGKAKSVAKTIKEYLELREAILEVTQEEREIIKQEKARPKRYIESFMLGFASALEEELKELHIQGRNCSTSNVPARVKKVNYKNMRRKAGQTEIIKEQKKEVSYNLEYYNKGFLLGTKFELE